MRNQGEMSNGERRKVRDCSSEPDGRENCGYGSESRIRMVTEMVERRKLTGELIAISPDPSAQSGVANKGEVGNSVRFRTFLGQKIVPSFTIFCQKRVPNGLEQAVKGQLRRVFHGRFY